MKKALMIHFIVLIAVLAGCSLTPEGAQSGASGLRLLQGTDGNTTTLSDPDHDDWSPQMVSWKGTNYIYFLSRRPYDGNGCFYNGEWNGSKTATNNETKIFRAEHVTNGVFTNLQLFYTFENNINTLTSIAVISNDQNGSAPLVIGAKPGDGITNIYLYSGIDDGYASEDIISSLTTEVQFAGGAWNPNQYTSSIFLGSVTTSSYWLDQEISVTGTVFRSYDINYLLSGPSVEGNAIVKIIPSTGGRDISEILNLIPEFKKLYYNNTLSIKGFCPALFTDGESERFGFYVSYNGTLFQMIYPTYPDHSIFINETTENGLSSTLNSPDVLTNQILMPLISVTHYPGSMDKTPSYDPDSGLYFSSDRDGKFNLYHVPKQYLRIPSDKILPEVMIK